MKINYKKFLAIILCFAIIGTYLGSDMSQVNALEGSIDDNSLHFLVRHWHDDDLHLNSGNGNLVQGYIVSTGSGYELLDQSGAAMTATQQQDYHLSFNAATGTVTIGLDAQGQGWRRTRTLCRLYNVCRAFCSYKISGW